MTSSHKLPMYYLVIGQTLGYKPLTVLSETGWGLGGHHGEGCLQVRRRALGIKPRTFQQVDDLF